MKKTINKNLIAAIIIALIACLTTLTGGCREQSEREQLPAPSELVITDEVLSWKEVENCRGYSIEVNGVEYETQNNWFDLFTVTARPNDYTIRVLAFGDWKNFEDSKWSNSISVCVRSTSTSLEGVGLKSLKGGMEYGVYASDPEKVSGKLIIPATYNNRPITQIVGMGFRNCTNLTGVIIPSTIEEISSGSFYNCKSLTRVYIDEGIEILGDVVFKNCTSLERVSLPNSVYRIGKELFSGCSSLNKVVLSESIQTIQEGTFKDCKNLKELEIPIGITQIEEQVFAGCDNLTSLTVQPLNSQFISEGNCVIRRADNAVVLGCKASIIPEGVEIIERNAFYGVHGLMQITLPQSVKYINNGAFNYCSDLQNVTLNEGLLFIGEQSETGASAVFENCAQLKSLTIPASVEYISPDVASSLKSIKSLTVADGNAVYKSEGNCIIEIADNQLIAGCIASEIPNYINSIGQNSFYKCPAQEIVLPEGLYEIKNQAFAHSTISELNLPSTVNSIGEGAFEKCLKLTSLNLPYGLEVVGNGAFENCNGITNIVIPESVLEIGERAFNNCNRATVLLPGAVQNIGSTALGVRTVYISDRSSANEGWYEGQNNATDPDWIRGGTKIWCCSFAGGSQTEAPYLYSFTVKHWQHDQANNNMYAGSYPLGSSATVQISYRSGYTFAGWSLNPNSNEIVIGTQAVNELFSQEVYYKTLCSLQQIKTLKEGSELYAVWQKI
ncbi:MAG: leucine-rich repeat domain-containing protein [Clostridia bacterium]|nr:leucine-rich repeat domain-containing protein [Clostridia bacterium]